MGHPAKLSNILGLTNKIVVFLVSIKRSSLPEVFCRKGVLGNFAKFTGKHLCQSLFFNKVVGLRPETLSKKRLWHRCFPVNFAKFLRTPFFTEHLLLYNLHLLYNSSNTLYHGFKFAYSISIISGWYYHY